MLCAADKTNLPNNYLYLVQLKSTEKRFAQDEYIRGEYTSTIKGDLCKGYVTEVPDAQKVNRRSDKEWYLFHHPVLNPNKPGKVRRVLNGAAKFHGASLNKSVLTVPHQLQNLMCVLFRFRKQPYAVSAEFDGMFLQVGVLQSDQPSLRFLLRERPTTNVVVYQNTRPVFGVRNSPTCANYALQRTTRVNPSFNTKLQKLSGKTFTRASTLNQWSLLRNPWVKRWYWYIFVFLGSSLEHLWAICEIWLIELMVLLNLLSPRSLFHARRVHRTCLG